MAAAAAAALHDLGALVLGDYPLNLEQKVVLSRAADRAVEEHNHRAGAAELLDQKRLMGVAAGEPIWGVHVNALDTPSGDHIAQLLQCRTKQDRAAIAFVHVGVIRLELPAIGRNPLAQGRNLARNGVVARLALARHARIECNAGISHAHLPEPSPSAGSAAGHRGAPVAGSGAARAPGGDRRRSGAAY
jgi:hypothetical protein